MRWYLCHRLATIYFAVPRWARLARSWYELDDAAQPSSVARNSIIWSAILLLIKIMNTHTMVILGLGRKVILDRARILRDLVVWSQTWTRKYCNLNISCMRKSEEIFKIWWHTEVPMTISFLFEPLHIFLCHGIYCWLKCL